MYKVYSYYVMTGGEVLVYLMINGLNILITILLKTAKLQIKRSLASKHAAHYLIIVKIIMMLLLLFLLPERDMVSILVCHALALSLEQ